MEDWPQTKQTQKAKSRHLKAGIGKHGFKDDAPRAAAIVWAAATAWEAAAREDGDAGEEAVEERNVGRSRNMEEGER